jgi:hypothetical protein
VVRAPSPADFDFQQGRRQNPSLLFFALTINGLQPPAPKKFLAGSDRIGCMYHYNPTTALEELTEEATLPNPVHVRDMMLRHKLSADQSLELNRIFVEYQKFFGEAQKLGKEILQRLTT